MRIIEQVPSDDLPDHAKSALAALGDPESFYCDRCDGLRLREHECRCWICRMHGIPDGTCSDSCRKEAESLRAKGS